MSPRNINHESSVIKVNWVLLRSPVANTTLKMFGYPLNPTASFIFDMRAATQYASPTYPIYLQGDCVCYQPVGPQAKDLPSPHLTSSPAMWKGSWRTCGSFSQPFTTVLHAVS